jgi:hypothetical protein
VQAEAAMNAAAHGPSGYSLAESMRTVNLLVIISNTSGVANCVLPCVDHNTTKEGSTGCLCSTTSSSVPTRGLLSRGELCQHQMHKLARLCSGLPSCAKSAQSSEPSLVLVDTTLG